MTMLPVALIVGIMSDLAFHGDHGLFPTETYDIWVPPGSYKPLLYGSGAIVCGSDLYNSEDEPHDEGQHR